MKTSKVFFIIFFLISFLPCYSAGTNKVVIAGVLSDPSLKDVGNSFCISIFNEYFDRDNFDDVKNYKIPIVNDSFCIQIEAPEKDFYFSFSIETANKNEINYFKFSKTNSLFLLESGDCIFINIRPHSVDFFGKGSEKLECQSQIYSLGYLPDGVANSIRKLENEHNYYEAYVETFKMLKLQTQFRHAILKNYKDKISQQAYNKIFADCSYQLYIQLFWSIHLAPSLIGSEQRIVAVKKFLNRYLESRNFIAPSIEYFVKSAYYPNYLFERERIRLEYSKLGNSIFKFAFKDIYERIKERYAGDLRDKLILISFIELIKAKPDALRSLDEAINLISNKTYKLILSNWKQRLVAGTPAFDFALPDTTGKIVHLTDFKGKIVIIDFWFTGCLGCTKIPGFLKIVSDKFRDNKNVVFLNINIDKDKNWWIYGLKQGIYTLPEHLSLSLYDLGSDHPMLKYYSYSSFPQILIIDPSGKNVCVQPTDPRKDGGVAIQKLISETLEELKIRNVAYNGKNQGD